MPPPDSFVGLDLSTRRQAEQGKTLAAIGQPWGQGVQLLEIRTLPSDASLLDLLQNQAFVACGVDAPLSLPPCVLCRVCPCDCPLSEWAGLLGFAADAVYHYRLSDLLLRKTVPGVSPKPPLSHGGPVDITPLTLRWLRLSRELSARKVSLQRVMEVYATGSIQLWAQALGLCQGQTFRYRSHPELRAGFLCELAEQGWLSAPEPLWERMVHSDDALDAAIACLSVRLAHDGRCLRPAVLLGLEREPAPSMVRPLQGVPMAVRRAMHAALEQMPWAALPCPAWICGGRHKSPPNDA